MATATIKLFLTEGDAKRLRTAELSNWTGKAVSGSRAELDLMLKRDEAANSGVYFLTGVDPESGKDAVYIGEAEVMRDRLKSRLDRDFWNGVTFVISKDENLTKAHIRYLEGRLIDQAKKADRALVLNNQSSGSKLPECDREDMEVFLERIHQLMPVLGADFLVPLAKPRTESRSNPTLVCEIKGLIAHGQQGVGGFLVYKGSQAVLTERASSQKYPYASLLRKRLVDDGTLLKSSNCYEFTKDREFTSPSAAAAVIHGGHANGLIAWKTTDGKTLKQLETDSHP